MENTEEVKKNNSGLYVIICSIIVLGVIIVGAYFFFLGDNKKVFVSALNNIYNNLNDTISDIEDSIPLTDKDTFLIHSKINIDSEEENLKMLKDYNLSLDLGVDYKNNLYTLNTMLSDKNNQKIISALLNYNNQNIYLSSKDLFSKVIAITNNEITDTTSLEIPTLNIDYYTTIRNSLTILKNTLSDSISTKDIKTNKEVITINNKKENVTSYNLSLDQEKLDKLYKDFQTNLSNDKDIVKAFATLLDLSEEEVKDMMQEESSFLNNVELTVYRKGFLDTFIGATLTIDDSTITYYDNDGYQELALENLSIIKNKNLTTIDLTNLDSELKTIKIEKQDEENYVITLDIKNLKPVKINLLYTIEHDVKLDLLDYKNSISIDEITEQDQNEIISNLTKILGNFITE